MTQEVKAHESLVEYYQISRTLWTDFDDKKKEFSNEEEWHYILSNLEQNIFLLKRLDEINLLKEENHLVDCGIGLGTTLFDFFIQSKEFTDKKFTFTGIEKYKPYVDFLKSNLLEKWEGGLNLIEDDIMNHNYENYNIIYTYTPFRNMEKLRMFYNKVISEMKSGSILIENKCYGLGLSGILTELDGIKKIPIDEIVVFVKI